GAEGRHPHHLAVELEAVAEHVQHAAPRHLRRLVEPAQELRLEAILVLGTQLGPELRLGVRDVAEEVGGDQGGRRVVDRRRRGREVAAVGGEVGDDEVFEGLLGVGAHGEPSRRESWVGSASESGGMGSWPVTAWVMRDWRYSW